MSLVTINGETQTVEAWAKAAKVPAAVIKERLGQGYANHSLVIDVETWSAHPRTRPARPKSDWEWAVYKPIWQHLPQHRFDVVLSLAHDIGPADLHETKLPVLLNRRAYIAAIKLIYEFNGPQGKPMMSWMRRRADNVLYWSDPFG